MMRAGGHPAAGALRAPVPLALLVPLAFLALPCGAPPARAQEWSEFGARAEQAPAAGGEIREPFFAFLLGMAESDSLDTWTGPDVLARTSRGGRPSKFPLADVILVRRSRPDPTQASRWPGAAARAVWQVRLKGDLEVPMPYSILGYHPGSLIMSGDMEFAELWLGDQGVRYRQDGETGDAEFGEVRIFALTAGKLVLDADGLVDALLGAALDDAWTLGFVVAREEGRPLGVGVSLGRKGRKIYGEFDFARDKILPGGRASAAALSGFSRRWLDPAQGNLPAPWE